MEDGISSAFKGLKHSNTVNSEDVSRTGMFLWSGLQFLEKN